jgi:2-dehydro-3-deoxyphosphogluconate aldolase / (4S)-4-hydroxy-2-oxoglutarate aldolase
MEKIFEQLGSYKLIPVIAIAESRHARKLAGTLISAGLPCAEITFRTAAAEDAIQIIAAEFPEMVLGAGTVLNVEQAQRARKAGAKYIVSPGFSPSVVEWCQENHLPVLPGVATSSEVMRALDCGLDVLKFFPSENMGGTGTLKSLGGPFKEVRFIPTGGITAAMLADYLALPNVLAVGGSWFVRESLIAGEQFEEIGKLTREALALIQKNKKT